MQTSFSHLILAIPHATGCFDETLWSDGTLVRQDAALWTDWFTDDLFGGAATGDNSAIFPVVGGVSRFDCDLERLERDPMEAIGQGRLYRRSPSGATRIIPADRAECWIREWVEYRERIVAASRRGPRPFVLDCHSYPTVFCPEVDVCLGFNEDASRPAQEVLNLAFRIFDEAGFRVAFNRPYSNSLTPDGYEGPSLMIELRKGVYMDEKALLPFRDVGDGNQREAWNRIATALTRLYGSLLAY